MRDDKAEFFWVQGIELKRANPECRNKKVSIPWWRKVQNEKDWEERRESVMFTQEMLRQEKTGPFG